jgi:restriction system protein
VDVDALQDYVERMAVLSPEEFEDMVAEWLRCLGWEDVEVQPMSGDAGKDIIGTDPHGNINYVEVKYQHGVVGRPIVQKLHSAMVVDKIGFGMIVTTAASFSSQAITEVEKIRVVSEINIHLITGTKFLGSVKSTIKHLTRGTEQSQYSNPCPVCGATIE